MTFAAKKVNKPWESEKLFQNKNEWFEYNCPPLELRIGKRLLHYINGQLVGAATIKKIKPID